MSAPNPPGSQPALQPDMTQDNKDRGLFSQQHKNHECHHYARMYGGQVANAMMWGFGATLGADVANAAVGEAKEWWRH